MGMNTPDIGIRKVTFQGDTVSIHSSDWTSANIRGAIRTAQEKKKKWYVILVVAAVLPVVCLCGLTLYRLSNTAHIRNEASEARDTAHNFIYMANTVQALQSERGMTSRYIGSSGASYFTDMEHFRGRTDVATDKLEFSIFETLPQEINTKSMFKDYLRNYRQEVNDLKHITQEAIRFYTELIARLIDATAASVELPEDIWRMQAAAGLLLRASEPATSQASTVRTFGFRCDISTDDMRSYQNLDGAGYGLMQQVFMLYHPVGETYNQRVQEDDLNTTLDQTKQILVSARFNEICMNISEADRTDFQFPWFQAFRRHAFLLGEIRNDLTTQIINELDRVVYDKENVMMLEIILFLIVAGVSLVIVAITTRKLSIIVNDLVAMATREKIATYKVDCEKRKVDQLLYSMIPVPVGEELKSGHDVSPKYFDSATFCFMDIVNFLSLISEMQPIKVTKLLNAFYKMFDKLIDQHKNVHKTEQYNDVYSAVSGVPNKINTHAMEMANFILDLMKNIENFKIEDFIKTKLQVRAGAHTGPCAAGVVAHKVLRYSIFGESVKIASRMSRYSEVQKIQISQETRDELLKYGKKYLMSKRGDIYVHGIGKVETYYLEGQRF